MCVCFECTCALLTMVEILLKKLEFLHQAFRIFQKSSVCIAPPDSQELMPDETMKTLLSYW